MALGLSAHAQSVDLRDFLSYDIGDQWTYSGTVSNSGTTLPIRSVNKNARAAFGFEGIEIEVDITLDGEGQPTATVETTLNANGKSILNASVNGTTSTFTPPQRELPLTLTVGQTTQSSGQIESFPDEGTYSLSTTIVGIEQVNTPLGSFQALKIQVNSSTTIEQFGIGLVTSTNNSTRWYARGIGEIKSEIQINDLNGLTATNYLIASTSRTVVNLPVDGPPPLLGQSSATGGGWYYSPWWGFVNPSSTYGWYYHEGLAWIYSASNNSGGPIWFYISGLGWAYTTANDFPSMYSTEHQSWIIWLESKNPNHRVFYDFTTMEEFTID